MNPKPLFIVFEGIDGAGKSTQCARLYHYISRPGTQARHLAEPTDGPWGQKIRGALRSGTALSRDEQVELFIRDRMDDMNINIRPCMEQGITIVMDRYFYSNAAYQGMDGLSPQSIIDMNLEHGFPLPDRVYFIDLSAESAMNRVRSRSGEKTELFEKQSFLEKVRQNFLSIADSRFLVVDGALPEDKIFEIIKEDFDKLAGSTD
ncbi:MAG: dTMP kinase [Spirochaetes bacterium]|nr:dTMP kinase [Spirochaetota bacterium]